jgi:hypothetical protein
MVEGPKAFELLGYDRIDRLVIQLYQTLFLLSGKKPVNIESTKDKASLIQCLILH